MKINLVHFMRLACITAPLLLTATLTMAQTPNPIVWSGGVSEDERAEAPTEGTRLSFFQVTGNYLSRVNVIVRDDSRNEVVNTTTDGPWLILDLPPGRYQVIATSDYGKVQSLVIQVTDSSQEFGFAFPE